jgi:uncharacterized membrane protein YkoI
VTGLSTSIGGVIAALCFTSSVLAADAGTGRRELAKALPQATVMLQQALAASGSQGLPLSGKFEVEDGHLQLSVYTTLDGQVREVIIDHKTGKTAKTQAIAAGEDLVAAKAQSAALAGAKLTLAAAVDKAEREQAGYRAVSVMPSLRQKRPVATVLLVKDVAYKTATESLD